jgi:RNA polymerase sigma-70 factor, ECF subfamily
MQKEEITGLFHQLNEGDQTAPENLLTAVYDDLRRLARAYFADERAEHTLQPTALVHEAYIRLVNWENVSWQNRAHFFAVAAEVMKKILIAHARRRNALKRSGGQRIMLDEAVSFTKEKEFDLIKLDDALKDLAKIDPRQARIVELRFFGGLSIKEAAHVLKISEATVRREWTFAKAWFKREFRRS